jgi:hypothetical protein
VAAEWWLDLSHPSYWARITWQLAQAAGLLVRYELAFGVDEGVPAKADQKAKSDSDQQSIADR